MNGTYIKNNLWSAIRSKKFDCQSSARSKRVWIVGIGISGWFELSEGYMVGGWGAHSISGTTQLLFSLSSFCFEMWERMISRFLRRPVA